MVHNSTSYWNHPPPQSSKKIKKTSPKVTKFNIITSNRNVNFALYKKIPTDHPLPCYIKIIM